MNKGTNEIRPRNPIVQASHRREVFWQITVPVLVGALLLIALAVFVSLGESGEVSQWADIAVIWLVIPAMVVTILFLAITAALAFAVIKLIQVLPYYAYRLQEILVMIRVRARQMSDTAVKPVTTTSSFAAAVRAFFGKRNNQPS